MVKRKPKTRVKTRPLWVTGRRLSCKGCGERGAIIRHTDGTSSYLTGLFYYFRKKCLDGGAVIACGRCQQIYLGNDDAKVIKRRLALIEQTKSL
jgi:hypothetical protein